MSRRCDLMSGSLDTPSNPSQMHTQAANAQREKGEGEYKEQQKQKHEPRTKTHIITTAHLRAFIYLYINYIVIFNCKTKSCFKIDV